MQIHLPYRRAFSNAYSVDLDGVNERLGFANNAFNALGDGTISMWFNLDTGGNDFMNIVKDINNRIQFFMVGGKVRIFARNGSGIQYWKEGSSTISTGSWYHIAWSKSGTTHLIYLNGVAETLTNLDPTNNDFYFNDISTPVVYTVGAYYDGASTSNHLDGKLDEISIWNSGLNAAQLVELYHLGKPSNLYRHSSLASLVTWIRCDGDSNPTLTDRRGSNNITMVNMEAGDIQTDVP